MVVRLPGRVADPEANSAFTVLYREQRLSMVRLAAFLVGDVHVAEDIVQDAFAGVHAHWRRLRDESAAVGYLRRAVVNRSRSVLRRRRTARAYIWPVADAEPGADTAVLATDEQQRLRQALARLPRRQREVLVLRYWASLSEAEIADTLGISPGTVKSTASRGVQALESALRRCGGGA
ncbi:MAG TPA: SigE family RNA polymerase sigma factor [Rugosimonospora sp.]|nr:SigE family RNA polymerase sigma factor [Rugosimonospora sp.]